MTSYRILATLWPDSTLHAMDRLVCRPNDSNVQPQAARANCGAFELTSRAAWRLQRFVGSPWVEILQSNSEASLQGRARLGDLPQKFWMVLDPVIEPIVLRFEADQDTGGSTVASDEDFFTSCQA